MVFLVVDFNLFQHILGVDLLLLGHGLLVELVPFVVELEDVPDLLLLLGHLLPQSHVLDHVVGHQTVSDLNSTNSTFSFKP